MKLHTMLLLAALICVLKFVFTPRSDPDFETVLLLLPVAMALFWIGVIAKSFDDDRKTGETTTRDALLIYLFYIVTTKWQTIVTFIFAVIMVILNKN